MSALTLLLLAVLSQLNAALSENAFSRRTPRRAAIVGATGLATTLISRPAQADELLYTILFEGDTSSPLPQRGQICVVDYTLWIGGF